MNDLDKLLKAALSPARYPSEELNNKIIRKVKEDGTMNNRYKKLVMAASVALAALILPISAYAAYKYLSPKEVADELEDNKLGTAFATDGKEVIKTVRDGLYKVTYLGHVTGKSISDRTGSAWELYPDRIYVAIAVERADGTAIKADDGHKIFVTPLIQGLTPGKYNIVTMNGGYVEKIIDGVLYRIIDCDNIGIFADKRLYLAVSDTDFYSSEAFDFNDSTGLISEKNAYQGTNVLFDLELDKKGADADKAAAYVEQFEKEWNSGSDTKKEGKNPKNAQQEEFYDKENNITFRVKDNDFPAWWGGGDASETVLGYSLAVTGEGIDTLTYTLNKGQFCDYPMDNPDGRKLYGSTYSVSYEDQKNNDVKHSVLISAKYTDYGYKKEFLDKLGEEDIDRRQKIYHDVLNEEINSTSIGLDIKMKDGRVIHKDIKLQNVLNEEGFGFYIVLGVE